MSTTDPARIELPLPPGPGVASTNCLVFIDDDGGVHLVDPGWADAESRAQLRSGLADLGRAEADIRTIVVTHRHPDHLGLAAELHADGFGRLVLSRVEHEGIAAGRTGRRDDDLERWGVPEAEREELSGFRGIIPDVPVEPDLLVDEGDRLPIPGRDVEVLLTPGHTAGSICLRTGNVLLTCDTVLPGENPGIGLGGFRDDDDPIGAALASLERIGGMTGLRGAPGHGPELPDVADRARALAAHHRTRSAAIAELAASGG